MKDGNSRGFILAFSVISLLILSSFGTFGTSVNSKNEYSIQTNSIKLKSSTAAVKMKSISIKPSTVKTYDNDFITLDIEDFNNSENNLIAGTVGNESYPSMVLGPYTAFVAYEYEDDSDPSIYIRKSDEFGHNWTNNADDFQPLSIYIGQTEISVNSPSFCIKPGEKIAYGIFFSKAFNSGLYGSLKIDITDLTSYNDKKWDFSYFPSGGTDYVSFWNFSHPDIVRYYRQNVPWISCYIGSTNYSTNTGDWSATETLFFAFLNASEPNSDELWIQWDHNLEYCSNISISVDDDLKNIYGVCEQKNGSNQDLLFFKGFHEIFAIDNFSINLSYQKFADSSNLSHPKIYVNDDDIYIASEIEIEGVYDIIIYHSSDGGDTWETYDPTGIIMVPPGEYIPKNPTVYVNETEIFCTFIEDNNLSLTISSDFGANWEDPIQINSDNGSVVEEYRFSDMPSEHHIVWTDNRYGNYDLYCIAGDVPDYNIGIVPGSFKLIATDFPFLRTRNYVTYKIKNIGRFYVEDVLIEVTVNRSGNTPFTTDYPGFIKHLEPGEELEFKEPLFRITLGEFIGALLQYIGVDHITLELKPRGAFPDSDLSDNTAKIQPDPVNYSSIFPFFSIFVA